MARKAKVDFVLMLVSVAVLLDLIFLTEKSGAGVNVPLLACSNDYITCAKTDLSITVVSVSSALSKPKPSTFFMVSLILPFTPQKTKEVNTGKVV
jgi:hypothetical protein